MTRGLMRAAVLAAGLLGSVGLCILGACGGPSAPPAADVEELLDRLPSVLAEEEALQALVDALGEAGRRDPETEVPRLLAALRAERADPTFDHISFAFDYAPTGFKGRARSEDLTRARDVLIARRQLVYPRLEMIFDVQGVDEEGVGRITIRLPRWAQEDAEAERARLERIRHVLAAPGTFALRPVVSRPAEGVKTPFEGDADAFDALRERLLAQAREVWTQTDWPPQREGAYRLHPLRPATPDGTLRKVILLDEADALDHRRMTLALLTQDGEDAQLGLHLQVLSDHVEEARSWLARWAGAEAALTVNNRAELIVPLPDTLEALKVLVVGKARDGAVQGWVGGVLRSVAGGYYRVPPASEIASQIPLRSDTPIARALAAVGPAAVPFLPAPADVLPAERDRMRYVREDIVRQQVGKLPSER